MRARQPANPRAAFARASANKYYERDTHSRERRGGSCLEARSRSTNERRFSRVGREGQETTFDSTRSPTSCTRNRCERFRLLLLPRPARNRASNEIPMANLRQRTEGVGGRKENQECVREESWQLCHSMKTERGKVKYGNGRGEKGKRSKILAINLQEVDEAE